MLSVHANIIKFEFSISKIGSICAHFHYDWSLSEQTLHSHTSQQRGKMTVISSVVLLTSFTDISIILCM